MRSFGGEPENRFIEGGLGRFVLIAGITFLVFLNAIPGQFVFDDWPLIRDNSIVHDLANWKTILINSYRPVRTFLLAVIYHFFELRPEAYHIVNIGVHVASAMMVYQLVVTLTGRRRNALLSSLIFAIHPVQADSVSYISGLRDTLCGFFYFSSFLSYVRYRENGRILWLVSTLGTYVLAILSKEMAVTLVAMFVLYDYWIRSGKTAGPGPGSWWEAVGKTTKDVVRNGWAMYVFLGIWTLAVIYYYVILRQSSSLVTTHHITWHGGSWIINYMTIPRIIYYYVRLTFFPVFLIADYKMFPILAKSVADPRAWAAVGFVILYLLGIASLWKKERFIAFSMAWFLIALLPVLNILPHHEFMAEHYLYIPMMGFSLFLGRCLDLSWMRLEKIGKEIWVVAACLVLIVGYAGRTSMRNNDWKDDLSLVVSQLKIYPNSPRARSELGYLYLNMNLLQSAQATLEELLKVAPGFPLLMNNLGAVYQRLGEYEKARDLFLKSGTSLRYGFSMPNTNLGLVYVILGDAQKAKTAFEDSIRYNPMDETAYTSLARVNLALGEYNEAEKYARLDLKYHPSSVDSLKLLITVNEKNFKWDEALGAARTLLKKNLGDKDRLKERVALLEEEKMKWQKAADLKKSRPLPSEWYETMSDLYVSVGIPAQARATLENGLKEYPNNATLRRSLGAVLLKLGDSGRAESELARAVEMDKSSPENYFLLAKTYTLGLEFQKARTAAEQVLRLKNDYPGADRLLKVIERDGKKYQSLVKRGLTDAPEGDLVIGDIYESYGLLDESLKYYRRALKGPGQKIRAMYRIANNKLKRGTIPDMMESIKVLKEITRLKPDEAEAYKNLGFTYLFRVEDYEEAYRYFKTSLRVDPEQPGADKLSRIVEALGGYIDAVVVKRIYVLPFVAELQNYKSMIGSSNESSKSIMAR